MAPETHYARNGDVSIAYQVTGEGPEDLVLVPGFVSHVELDWSAPEIAAFLGDLGSFCRLIRFDKRGTGLSDPVASVPTLEERMDDVRAVMDAADSQRATLMGYSEGGPMSLLFAATYPERVSGLLLYGSFATGSETAPHEGGLGPEASAALRRIGENWGQGLLLEAFGPSKAADPVARRLTATFERAAASPGMVAALLKAMETSDVNDVLPLVNVPTVVVHRRDERIPVAAGRYLAERIPGARLVEMEGVDHYFFLGDTRPLLNEIEDLVTGAHADRSSRRALATVLFTDIVGSTERAAELGDEAWRLLLERHDEVAEGRVTAHGGRVVKSLGDGLFATFDGPAQALRAAEAVRDEVQELGIEVRAGVHTGECEVLGDDLGGMAVHIGARVSAIAGSGEVLATSTVRELVVGSGLAFTDRGPHTLKGVPGEWQLFSVGGTEGTSPSPSQVEPVAMGLSDRMAVGFARRAPGLARAGARVGSRLVGRSSG